MRGSILLCCLVLCACAAELGSDEDLDFDAVALGSHKPDGGGSCNATSDCGGQSQGQCDLNTSKCVCTGAYAGESGADMFYLRVYSQAIAKLVLAVLTCFVLPIIAGVVGVVCIKEEDSRDLWKHVMKLLTSITSMSLCIWTLTNWAMIAAVYDGNGALPEKNL
eukprot:m51a1_g9543 hypothetical protein (164) ;mRNA; f:851168-851960